MTVKMWKLSSLISQGRGTPCNPFSPPVRSVHLNAISKAICEKASVSSEKYRPRRRRMISAIAVARTRENRMAKTNASASLLRKLRIEIATA